MLGLYNFTFGIQYIPRKTKSYWHDQARIYNIR